MLEIFKPIYIVFENVPKIRSGTLEPPSFRSGLGRPLNLIEAALLRLGYSFVYRVEMATDHGSSQKRERLILCATLRGYPIFEHPSATHSALPPDHKNRPPGLLDAPTIIDTIGDLSAFDLTTNFDDEPASTMKRYASRPMNDEQERLRDGLKEVSLHIPVHYQDLKKNTILDVPLRADASFKDLPKKYLKAMKGEIHPNWYRRLPSTSHFITFTCSLDPLGWGGAILHYGQARTYSIREMARGQGIRDSIEFEGSLREIVSQIGNSVPWQLAYAIAKSLKKTLDREDGEDE
ncbi:S-adenosyl-L-methionine-dependent methyltransferase [Mrakia frigida]|uniref:S-adenosyl-L-methionine-dependent methyltransferase n=1 Tax=Mrakia frigida TaxID=29902 RepID=UPI003FCC010F